MTKLAINSEYIIVEKIMILYWGASFYNSNFRIIEKMRISYEINQRISQTLPVFSKLQVWVFVILNFDILHFSSSSFDFLFAQWHQYNNERWKHYSLYSTTEDSRINYRTSKYIMIKTNLHVHGCNVLRKKLINWTNRY